MMDAVDGDDAGGDVRSLSYDEIAEARGISRTSAIRLVQRKGWRRQPGNDGTVRVMVPPTELNANKADAPGKRPDDTPDDAPDASWIVAVLERQTDLERAALERQIDQEREEKKQIFSALTAERRARENERTEFMGRITELTEQLGESRAENAVLVAWLSWWNRWRWERRKRKRAGKGATPTS